ncbi:MAG: TetM/TetW/TetO/TetS family tetracycline resistance ribosomal protection protein [Clostridia bacterium]|nr:TetM/TetW/TetO/TetS family tetracycline resistance ribosomal protection protein [Clostridia bacterium]
MKRIAAGILAHVDAGKTTLSEGLLYCSGAIRQPGRVDAQNTFLDTDEMERRRGITIFSKQAVLTHEDTIITLLDTPGHVDFSAEAERTLGVLDYAVLVVSATDGIQSHTKTLWELLTKRAIPVFVFINKMDLAGADKNRVIFELQEDFNENFVDFTEESIEVLHENLAMCDETVMHEFLEQGTISEKAVAAAIRKRNVFPCFCGSALKHLGVDVFFKAFVRLTEQSLPVADFGARIFKIGQDEKGNRLTFMKITGGSLRVKSLLTEGMVTPEKVNEIRIYSGEKYSQTELAEAGCVCAITGPVTTYAGQGLGFEKQADKLMAEPIFTYRVILPEGTDTAKALASLRELEQEETQLHVTWNEQLKEIQMRLMGEIQLEVLKQQILKRFGLDVAFEEGRIVYKETIASRTEGVGHYEPLRHYAEVHLLLEPLERGAGMQFETDCAEDILEKNWQRLILTHLMEKTHVGVLTGSPITDMKITLKSGRAHEKHTDGGDFRQATYRAVRQGLRSAKSLLLEPYYDFVLEVPAENVGRAMTDMDRLGASFSLPQTRGNVTKISGRVAAEAIRDYHRELIGYTHGCGKLSCQFGGYGPCKNQEAVISRLAYDCDRDVENTADSVFCEHGAGFTVKWNEVPRYMHLESILKPQRKVAEASIRGGKGRISASNDELMAIFEKTYGKIQTRHPGHVFKTPKDVSENRKTTRKVQAEQKEYLLIDGYNIIFAWESLQALAEESLEAARAKLTDRIATYKAFKMCEIILVFDAYKVKGNRGETEEVNGITLVYTKEAQTADAYIEKAAKELSQKYKVTVATSDGLEQLIIFGSGAYRMPARALEQEVLEVEQAVQDMMAQYKIEAENADFIKTIQELLAEKESMEEKD